MEANISKYNQEIEEKNLQIVLLNASINLLLLNQNEIINDEVKQYAEKYIGSNKTKFRMDIGFGQLFQYSDTIVTEFNPLQKGYGIWINPGFGVHLNQASASFNDALLFAGMAKFTIIDTITEVATAANIRYVSATTEIFTEYSSVFVSNKLTANRISFGGDYKFDNQKFLQLGFLLDFDNQFKLVKIQPTLMLNLEIGKDVLK